MYASRQLTMSTRVANCLRVSANPVAVWYVRSLPRCVAMLCVITLYYDENSRCVPLFAGEGLKEALFNCNSRELRLSTDHYF